MVAGRQSRERATFVPTLLSNLLPLVGIAFFGWRARNVLFVYWVEIGSLVVIYSGLALFAERDPAPDGRTISPVTIPVPFLSGRSGSVRPVSALPPIYYRNVRYAVGLLVWGLGFWACLSVMMVVLPSPASLDLPLVEYPGVVADATSPASLANAVALVASQLATVRDEFLGQRRYERLSAPMTVEVPVRQVVFWFLLSPVATLLLPLVTLPLVVAFDATVITRVGVATIVVVGKLTIEWSTFRAQRRADPGVVAGWFTPEESNSG